jgi:hypothetical protein
MAHDMPALSARRHSIDTTRREAIAVVRAWLASGEPMWVPIAGGSMARSVPDGSRVLVHGVAPDALRPGDLILHEARGRLVCHRVIRRRIRRGRVALLTRGDAWRQSGRWIADRQVLGRVMAIDDDRCTRRADGWPMRLGGLMSAATAESRRVGRGIVARVGRLMRRAA